MLRSRIARAFAVLVLIVAQAGLGLPHLMMGEAAMAYGSAQPMGPMAQGDCHRGTPGLGASQDGSRQEAPTPMPPCGSCPASMPGGAGGCLAMASCGPVSATPVAAGIAVLATISVSDLPPAISSPAAHDFIPDPPPPRA